MKKIINLLNSLSSKGGYHYYPDECFCGKKTNLDKDVAIFVVVSNATDETTINRGMCDDCSGKIISLIHVG